MQRNKILCFFATIIIAAVTIYVVFRGGGVSFGQLAESIKEASVPGIILSCISMFGFIFFEGEALREIVFHMGYPTKHRHAFVYSAADIYFSAITPSASGGQPASAFFMIKDGMPATTVMAALLVNLIMYTLAVISIGVFAILTFPKIFLNFSVVCKWDYCLKCSCDHILLIVKKTGNFEKISSLAGGIFKEDSLRSCC